MNKLDEYYTVLEVADILQISNSLVYRLIQRGSIIAHRVGDRQYRISESDLKSYLVEHRACHNQPTEGMPGRHTSQAMTKEAPI